MEIKRCTQVKIISSGGKEVDLLEAQTNQWLKDNPYIDVLSITISGSGAVIGNTTDCGRVYVLITYITTV